MRAPRSVDSRCARDSPGYLPAVCGLDEPEADTMAAPRDDAIDRAAGPGGQRHCFQSVSDTVATPGKRTASRTGRDREIFQQRDVTV